MKYRLKILKDVKGKECCKIQYEFLPFIWKDYDNRIRTLEQGREFIKATEPLPKQNLKVVRFEYTKPGDKKEKANLDTKLFD